MNIKDVREKFPQYNNMSDGDLAKALHEKFYSDMPFEKFASEIGVATSPLDVGYWDSGHSALDMMLGGAPTKINAGLTSLFAGTASGLMGRGFNYSEPYNRVLAAQRRAQEQYENQNPTKANLAKGAGFVGGLAMLPGIGRGVKGAIGTGAVYGGASGALQDANSFEERAKNTLLGVGAGASVGGLLAGGASLANKIRTPNQISPETQALASILQKEGVDLTAGQKTNNEALRYLEAELGGNKAAQLMEKQGEQFTAAVLKRAGIKSNRATPEVIDRAFSNIGKQFDDLAARNDLIPDQQLADDLTKIVGDYSDMVGNEARPVVMKLASNVYDIIGSSGKLTGAEYKSASSAIKSAARSSNHPETKMALNELSMALDDAMERSIAATNPRDAGKFAEARRLYRNILVVEQAATGAGQNTAQGLISPPQLRQAAVTKHGRRNYARGKGDFADLARAGEGLMKALPQSGTAPRTWARNIGQAAPTLTGAVLGGAIGNVPGMLAGGLLGAVAPNVMGKGLLSAPVQRYLTRQGGKISPEIAKRLAAEGGILGSRAVLGSP